VLWFDLTKDRFVNYQRNVLPPKDLLSLEDSGSISVTTLCEILRSEVTYFTKIQLAVFENLALNHSAVFRRCNAQGHYGSICELGAEACGSS
jgi:hypothetical protein